MGTQSMGQVLRERSGFRSSQRRQLARCRGESESSPGVISTDLQTPYGDLHVVPIDIIPYPYPLSTVFPQYAPPADQSQNPSIRRGQTGTASRSSPLPSHAINGAPAGVGAAKDLLHDVERGNTSWEETMGFLKITEYRYTRFALDPATGRWAMIRYVFCPFS
jgi:cation-transporting ATPase 13A2